MSAGHGVNLVELALDGIGLDAQCEPIVSAIVIAGVVGGAALAARRELGKAKDPLLPDSKLTKRNAAELLVEFLFRLGDSTMGKRNRKYLPFVGCLFLYIFSLNLFGLVPGCSMPTDSFTFNLGIALVVFVMYNAWGVKSVGIINYLRHLWGPIFYIGPLLFLVELISHIIRPVSLSVRLYGNMTGDHMVLQIFTDLTKVGIPVVFYCLGAFVCFMQAFVFTLLTMIYIRFAVADEESH